jgi:hypothetical protein
MNGCRNKRLEEAEVSVDVRIVIQATAAECVRASDREVKDVKSGGEVAAAWTELFSSKGRAGAIGFGSLVQRENLLLPRESTKTGPQKR